MIHPHSINILPNAPQNESKIHTNPLGAMTKYNRMQRNFYNIQSRFHWVHPKLIQSSFQLNDQTNHRPPNPAEASQTLITCNQDFVEPVQKPSKTHPKSVSKLSTSHQSRIHLQSNRVQSKSLRRDWKSKGVHPQTIPNPKTNIHTKTKQKLTAALQQ